MACLFQDGGALYDIDDMKIAVSNRDGTFGPLYDVPAVSVFRIEYVAKTANANGDGAIQVVASAIESANITITNVGLEKDVLSVLYPSSQSQSGGPTGPTIIDMDIGRPYPYFAILARVFDAEHEDSGSIFFIPKIKITSNPTWEFSYNVVATPEVTGMALGHCALPSLSGRNRFVRQIQYTENLPLLDGMTLPI